MDDIQLTEEDGDKYFQETAESVIDDELKGRNCISTGSDPLDNLLGHPNVCGVTKSVITEFCGFPGSGKTQIW